MAAYERVDRKVKPAYSPAGLFPGVPRGSIAVHGADLGPLLTRIPCSIPGTVEAGMIGRELGHFRIVESIGAGGMGVVYEATDTRLRRSVALKLLPGPHLAALGRETTNTMVSVVRAPQGVAPRPRRKGNR